MKLLVLAVIVGFLSPISVLASHAEHCELQGIVQETSGKTTYSSGQSVYFLKVKFRVKQAKELPFSHVDCQAKISKEYDINLQSMSKHLIKAVGPGMQIHVEFKHISGLTPNVSETWKLVGVDLPYWGDGIQLAQGVYCLEEKECNPYQRCIESQCR